MPCCQRAALSAAVLSLSLGTSGGAQTGPAPMMNHAPAWSPTGNWILFDSDRSGRQGLYLIDPDSGTVRRLTGGAAAVCCGRWSRDGQSVLFVFDAGGERRTMQIGLDGSGQQPVADIDELVAPRAPDGTRLTTFERDGYSVVVTVGADGTRRQLSHATWASQPSWSPDGRLIVYEDRAGDDVAGSRIVVMDRDGRGRRSLAPGTDPSWSPDGTLILFKTPTSQAGGFGWEVATIRPDGSALVRLGPGVHPTWSPHGSRIAFMVETGPRRTDIWLMNRDGTGRRCLTCGD